MKLTPSLSVDLQAWVRRSLRFDGAAYVFADGTRFEDVRAALQAAWLADDFTLALNLARRHGVDRIVCVRCASARSINTATMEMEHLAQEQLAPVWWYLCRPCRHDVLAVPRLRDLLLQRA